MASRTLSSTCLALASLVALAATLVRAQGPSISPFMPPAGTATSAPTPGATIEFRGVMEDATGLSFRIYDPAKKTGTWVKLNQKDPTLDVTAKQFNSGTADAETLTVEFQGRTLTLAQRTAKVVSSGSAAAQPPPMAMVQPPSNMPAAVTNAVVVNPTPADEAKRLDAVAQEVARRRALREQAANGVAPGTQQGPQPQQMPQQQPQTQGQRPQPAKR